MNATKECCLESPVSVNRQKLQEIWSKLERLFDNGAKQDLVEIGGVKPLTNSGETAKAEVVVEMLAKDQVEEFRATKVELDAIEIGAKQNLVEIGGATKDEQESFATKEEQEFCATKVELEERRTAEVVVEECVNKEVMSSSGQLDPGERDQQVTAKDKLGQESGAKQDLIEIGAKQDPVEEFCATKVELEFRVAKDAEFELLRFVMAGCRAQNANSEYG